MNILYFSNPLLLSYNVQLNLVDICNVIMLPDTQLIWFQVVSTAYIKTKYICGYISFPMYIRFIYIFIRLSYNIQFGSSLSDHSPATSWAGLFSTLAPKMTIHFGHSRACSYDWNPAGLSKLEVFPRREQSLMG